MNSQRVLTEKRMRYHATKDSSGTQNLRLTILLFGGLYAALEDTTPRGPSRAVPRLILARGGGGIAPWNDLVLVPLFNTEGLICTFSLSSRNITEGEGRRCRSSLLLYVVEMISFVEVVTMEGGSRPNKGLSIDLLETEEAVDSFRSFNRSAWGSVKK